jgi:5-methylcytosine-specific restriction endonuclease McrA
MKKSFRILSLKEKVRLSKAELRKYRKKLKSHEATPKKKRRTKEELETIRKESYKKYLKYLQSEQWKEIRSLMFGIYGEKCSLCDCKENLEIHHKTYKNLFKEKVTDLMILCQTCHFKEHKTKILKKRPAPLSL